MANVIAGIGRTKLSRSGLLVGALVAASAMASKVNAAAVTAVGTYDSTTNANAVDFNAPVTGTTGLGLATTADTAGTPGLFNTTVATAYTAGFGGVIDAENLAGAVPTNGTTTSVLTTAYGSGKSVAFTNTTTSSLAFSNNTGRTAISGSFFFNKTTAGATNNDYAFTVGTPTGGLLGEQVVSVGFTYLSRTSTGTTGVDFGSVSGTATFSDGSTLTEARNITEVDSAGDTFYGFVAPAGAYVTSFALTVPGTANYSGIDDIGFVTAVVPEPTSIAVLGLGGLMLARRRSR